MKKKKKEDQLDYSGLPKKDVYFLEKRKALKAERRTQDVLKREKWASLKEKLGYQPKRSPADVEISSVARKAINLVAPKGGIVKALTQTTKKKSGRGRGRPGGTYKTRVLPSGKVVKVPTHIYKKMVSQEKATMRLARARQQAQLQMQADQIAMQQDPRFQPSSSDQFLAEPDQAHEMNVAMAQQQADLRRYEQEQIPQQRGSGMARRFVDGVSRLGEGVSRLGIGRQQPTMFDQFGRQMPQQIQRPQVQRGIVREPRVTAISEKANLLRVSNEFNRPRHSSLLGRRRR